LFIKAQIDPRTWACDHGNPLYLREGFNESKQGLGIKLRGHNRWVINL